MLLTNPVRLDSCLKTAGSELGKAVTPGDTVARVRARLSSHKRDILQETRRIDTGRLNIPVYMSICANEARALLPTRKQMGKGATAAQAEASAVMELMERHAFFGFWQRQENFHKLGWKDARKRFGQALIDEKEILRSVQDNLDKEAATSIMDLATWIFYPATSLSDGSQTILPIDWFRMLGEFNGSSAGNTTAESVLQGLCELVERHVCCLADRERPELPTIAPASCVDPVLERLLLAFADNGIHIILKDMTLGMPVPTVGALAWDPSTFPKTSEIIFTAGTASSPRAAAIRAITEVAQLAGDFCTSSCYEASGLPKFSSLDEAGWLLRGKNCSLSELPTIENDDIATEVLTLVEGLHSFKVYSIATSDPELQIPAHWTIAPGLEFRERDRAQSLGLFVGRKLAEAGDFQEAMQGLDTLANFYPKAHFLPFFRGLIALRHRSPAEALDFFLTALPLQPHADAQAMASFYAGYALTLENNLSGALPHLEQAFRLCPQMTEYGNLVGVTLYRLGEYAKAEEVFDQVLKQNKGSALDLANRGVCRKLQGKMAAARDDLEMAIELDPSLGFAKKHLADM